MTKFRTSAMIAALFVPFIIAGGAQPAPAAPPGSEDIRQAAIHNTTFEPGSQIIDPDGNLVTVGEPDKTPLIKNKRLPPPPAATTKTPRTSCPSFCYFYSGAYTTFGSPYKQGVRVESTIQKPGMDGSDWPGGGHTLTELAAENTLIGTGDQIVEIGWGIDGPLNGDGWTHLFAYAWKNGVGLGYNAAGGFVDNGSVSRNVGDNINTNVGTSQRLAVQYLTTGCGCTPGWWVAYGSPTSQWIGLYPDSTIWNASPSVAFTTVNFAQAFGEIAAVHTPSCTDIGNGNLGSATGTYPTSGAELNTFASETSSGGAYTTTAYSGLTNTDATKWKAVLQSGSTSNIRYGGPGATPDPGACP